MAKFLIEVPHEAEKIACARVVEIFLKFTMEEIDEILRHHRN